MDNKPSISVGQWIFGLLFIGAGLFLIVAKLLDDPAANTPDSKLIGILAGVIFLIPGLWVFRAHRLWRGHITMNEEQANMMWIGLVCASIGLFIMVMSVADPDDSNFHAPRWIVAAAGALFLLAGLYLVKTHALDKGAVNAHGAGHLVFMAVMFSLFGMIASWAALGPGERQFSSSVSFLFVTLPAGSDETLGRLCFLPGALIMDTIAAVLWVKLARRVFKPLGHTPEVEIRTED